MQVKINCTGSFALKLSDIQKMQGELKELTEENYQKLKNNIIENGFCFPFFIWEKKTSTKTENMLVDGHQRLTALIVMAEEKIEMPEQFPCIKVLAKTKKQAMKLILSASSNYGTMTTLGLESFMDGIGLDLEETASSFTFDAIDFDKMLDVKKPIEEQSYGDKNNEIDTDNFGSDLQHTCPSCGFEFND